MQLKFASLILLFSASAFAESGNWYEKVKLSGDFRYRFEQIEQVDAKTNNRERIRARIKTVAQIDENIVATIGLSTEPNNITSRNQTLTDGGTGKSVAFDLAYFDYAPMANTNILAGKMVLPFYTPGKGSVAFDSDWTPEGLALKYKLDQGSWGAFANFASLWFVDQTNVSDVKLYAPQVGFEVKNDTMSAHLGYGFYNFSSIQGETSLSGKGNTMSGTAYVNGYKLSQVFADVSFKLGEMKTSLYGDYFKNSSANSKDTAYLVGTTLGLGKWGFKYNYRHVEADAILGVIADSDSFGSNGTGGEGHRYEISRNISDHFSTGLSYFAQNIIATKKHYQVLQWDFVAKF